MTPEERQLLERTHALAKDNHHILRSIRRHQLLIDFGKFIFWLVLLLIGAYYYLFSVQPIVDKLVASGALEIPGTFFGIPSADIQKFIDNYRAKQ